jgi:hypothetical protein
MPAYATQADFEGYVPGWTTDDPAELAKLLERASRDVDYLLGPLRPLLDGPFAGFKVDPSTLADPHRTALARATCAQAEYRFRYVEPGVEAATAAGGRNITGTKGPDFEVTYGQGADTVSGAGRRELAILRPITLPVRARP